MYGALIAAVFAATGVWLGIRLTRPRERVVVREIRGLGLMVGIELREKAGKYIKALMEDHGVLALPAGANVIRLLPPLIITPEEIEIGVQAIAATLPA